MNLIWWKVKGLVVFAHNLILNIFLYKYGKFKSFILFIYRKIGEFMDKNLLYNSRPFGHFELKCLKKDTLGVKKLTKNRGWKKDAEASF